MRIWFVPSRKRDEYGSSAANATFLPSGDHVGAPGPKFGAFTCVTAPLATSTTLTAARRHAPSTSRNAILLPSGDHAGECAAFVRCVSGRDCPERASYSHRFSTPLRSDAYTSCAPSGDHAGSDRKSVV